MIHKVILAEKYSVALSIAKVIGANESHRSGVTGYLEGNGYKVTWAAGHLVRLLSPEKMGYQRDVLPIFPESWPLKVKETTNKNGKMEDDEIAVRQLSIIESLFNNCTEIIVATDAGREGELIFRYIYEYLGCRTPFRRLWISSLTDEAIRNGMNDLRNGHDYDSLSDAGHARSQADWLVGFNASRALMRFTASKRLLSLGRVQSPTLAMICERFIKNKDFVPTPFWQLEAITEKAKFTFKVTGADKFNNETGAENALSRVKNDRTLIVNKVERKNTSVKPPLLFDLTSLQRAANSKYGLTAQETLDTAQALYEKRYITYPRTGSRYIPNDVFKTIPSLLGHVVSYGKYKQYTEELIGTKLCKKSVNDTKITDHHALLPTYNIPSGLTSQETKVYELILSRMLEAFGQDYQAIVTTVDLTSAGVPFKAKGSVPTVLGWKAVNGTESVNEQKKETDDEIPETKLPELKEGDRLPVINVESIRKTDKPLPIYTDSSLLAEMETCGKRIDDEELRESMKDIGLGTPATRAAIIENIIGRGYVERVTKKLIPTKLGLHVYSLIKGRTIADVKTTGEWEHKLQLIQENKYNKDEFSDGIRRLVEDIISDLKEHCTTIKGLDEQATIPCPCCGKPLANLKFSYMCDSTKGGCGLKINKEIAGKKLPESAIKALCAGKDTSPIKGFKSKEGKSFEAMLTIDKESKSVKFKSNKIAEIKTDGLTCPTCGGNLEKDKAKLICKCGFSIWTMAYGKPLTEQQIKQLLAKKEVALYGLKSKKGKTFNAALFYNEENKQIETKFIDGKK